MQQASQDSVVLDVPAVITQLQHVQQPVEAPSRLGSPVKQNALDVQQSPAKPSGKGSRASSASPNTQQGGQLARQASALSTSGTQEQVPSWPRRAWRRTTQALKTYRENVRKRPLFMLAPPILAFMLCIGLGVYGVMAGAHKQADDTRAIVHGSALDWAASFKLSFEKAFTPLVTLQVYVKQTPNYTLLEEHFPAIASDLLATVTNDTISELQVSPMGIISAIWPPTALNIQSRLYADIFSEPALRGGALDTIRQRQVVLSGPLNLINGSDIFGAIARLPIFIQNSTLNETFGTNKTLPTNCSDLCWNPETREKFWGFVTAILPLDNLKAGNDSRLDLLKQKHYRWKMTRPYTSTEHNPENLTEYIFANSSSMPVDPVSVTMDVSNAVWTLYLAPEEGWTPSWQNGMLILVCLGSFVLALLLGLVVASWAEQKSLLGEVMASNQLLASTTKHLEEEKLRLDALLVRQYNLISVLGGPNHKGGSAGAGSETSPLGSTVGSKQGLTLDRIEAMRRQLAVNTNTATADIDSIQTLELIGEGTFGKVYKGLWRGTVVAVKTMVLPANMSGAEKREKMAVMEAAISSSLSHPNIVQTYTYAIRPIKDQGSDMPSPELLVADSLTASGPIKSQRADNQPSSTASTHTGGGVHSYEVRLVLEYCDHGCLRDALDAGALFTDWGVNYRAVLDLAADTAKAMVHLHSLNVLHADLKPRNIMLKGDGQGVVAKIADFGLSLKMDHMETHMSNIYQGTITHMAPEILLEGHVSKGADIYAFGITMWEIFTGGHPFKGVPRALLGHQIAREALRPRFPDCTPAAYRQLAERCWHPLVDMRPTFDEVLDSLLQLRAAEEGETLPLLLKPRPPAVRPGSQDAAPLPACAGVASHVLGKSTVGFAMEGGSATEGDWAKSVVRQRPLTLPKIQEGGHELDDNEDGHQVSSETDADAGSGAITVHPMTSRRSPGSTSLRPPPPALLAPTAASLPAGAATGPNQQAQDVAHTMLSTAGLPSGVVVMDASAVGDSHSNWGGHF